MSGRGQAAGWGVVLGSLAIAWTAIVPARGESADSAATRPAAVTPAGAASDSARSRAPAGPRRSGAARAPALKVTQVVLIAVNRAFPDYHERIEAKPRVRFHVGDTEYSARIVEFVPAFSMDLKTRKVFSYASEPENPAFRIIVEKAGAPEDTTWAFMNMPPHFARHSMLAFLVQRVEFENHVPVEATRPGAPPRAKP